MPSYDKHSETVHDWTSNDYFNVIVKRFYANGVVIIFAWRTVRKFYQPLSEQQGEILPTSLPELPIQLRDLRNSQNSLNTYCLETIKTKNDFGIFLCILSQKIHIVPLKGLHPTFKGPDRWGASLFWRSLEGGWNIFLGAVWKLFRKHVGTLYSGGLLKGLHNPCKGDVKGI